MSWDNVLQEIRKARESLGNPDTIWYRGHWSSGYSLVPSLLRVMNGVSKERLLFEKYRQAAAHLLKERDSDWGNLFEMQHLGIPTRLLDWTETLGVAVFFALGTQPGEGALYVLDPVALNKISTGTPEVKRADDAGFSYRAVYWDKKPFAPRLPIALAPPFQNGRMFAQRGNFTVHGDDERSLEAQCPSCFVKVALPADARSGAQEFLEFASLNELSIFPDIVGIANHIRNSVMRSHP
jgi:hypothetical protein